MNDENSLFDKLKAIENRLGIIEDRLGMRNQPSSLEAKPKAATASSPNYTRASIVPTQSAYNPTYRQQEEEQEGFGAGKFLGVIGIICFILASTFLIKLAVDSGWLTPERQLGLASSLGIVLVCVGMWFQAKDMVYASLLPGAGIVILNMCAYAGNLYYHFYDATMSALLATVISCLSFYLYKTFRNEFYVIVAIIGSYLSVFFFPEDPSSLMSVMGFFIVWDIGFSILSILLSSRTTTLVATYAALGGFFAVTFSSLSGESRDALSTVLIFQCIQFFIFVSAIGFYSIQKKKPLADGESWAYFPLLLFFYGLEYFIVAKLFPAFAPFIAMAFAVVVYGIYFFFKSKVARTVTESQGVFNSFVIVVFFHAFYLEYLPEHYTSYFAILVTIFMLWFYRSKKNTVARFDHLILSLAFLAIFILNYMKVLWDQGRYFGPNEIIVLNILFFSVLFVAYSFGDREKKSLIDKNSEVLLFIADVQALTALWRISHRLTENSSLVPVREFMTSILWALFAIAILFVSKAKKDRMLSRSALIIFGFAIGKVLLFDVASAGSVARVICFLILGVVFYTGGYLYRYIDKWTKSDN